MYIYIYTYTNVLAHVSGLRVGFPRFQLRASWPLRACPTCTRRQDLHPTTRLAPDDKTCPQPDKTCTRQQDLSPTGQDLSPTGQDLSPTGQGLHPTGQDVHIKYKTCTLNIRFGTNGVAMARYEVILCQNEAYHFQKAFPHAPGPPGSIYNSNIYFFYGFRVSGVRKTYLYISPHWVAPMYFPSLGDPSSVAAFCTPCSTQDALH